MMANQTGNFSNEPIFEESELMIIHILFAFFGFTGLLVNIIVVAVIIHKRLILDLPSSWFGLSLAIADAVFSSTGIPAMHGLCTGASYVFLGVVVEFLTIASAGNLLTLTFNRFLSVYSSLRYPALMTPMKAKILVVVPWATALVLSAVVWISCQAGIDNALYLLSAYYTTLVILISALNIYMFKTAREKLKVTARQKTTVQEHNRKLPNKKFCQSVRLLLVTLTFYGACIPTIILLFLYPTVHSRETRPFKRKIIGCFLVSLFNAVLNPFLYQPSTNHPMFKRYFNNVGNQIFQRRSVVVMQNTQDTNSVTSL